MSKKKNGDRYVVQPKISPPQPEMQSQYRIVISNQVKDAMKVDDEIIRVVSSEKIHKDIQGQSGNEVWREEWDGVVEVSTGVSSEVEEKVSKRGISEDKSDY